MTGALSLPSAVLALTDFGHQRAAFAILAFACLLISSFGLLKRLLDLKIPKLAVACSPEIKRCKQTAGTGENVAYRVSVINKGREPIRCCKARLWRITKDSSVEFDGDSPQLSFTPSGGPDSESKTLEYRVPHTLDVLYLHRNDSNKVVLATKVGGVELAWGHRPLREVFHSKGKYRLFVVVSGDPLVHVEMVLLFNWTGDYQSSELTLEKVEPSDALDPNPQPDLF